MRSELTDMVVRTDADLDRMWQLVMGQEGPGRRSLWMALLDDEGRVQPVIVPIDDVPDGPGALTAGLAEVIAEVRDLGEAVLLLSRPGPGEMSEADRRWGRALAPLTRRPVHLHTRIGVRVFAPDDLVPIGGR